MTVHFTRWIARDNSVDSPECDGAKFDSDGLTNAVPLRHQSVVSDAVHMASTFLLTLTRPVLVVCTCYSFSHFMAFNSTKSLVCC